MFLNHDGTAHKIAHNVTSIALIPLTAWFIYALYTLRNADYAALEAFIAAPLNLIVAILFTLTTLKHFTLELETVFEDYISCPCARNVAIITLKLFAFVLGLTVFISILKIGL
ncbi:MAG: succinate dehydrogenase, hydrophobic membrane anchor protein [Alphaproteobacteria bacterium]